MSSATATSLITRDLPYEHDGTTMLGMLLTPDPHRPLPTVLLFHDAFGLGDMMIDWARSFAALGYAVVAADIWGGRLTPTSDEQIGPLIGSMVADRPHWIARAAAALDAAQSLPEVDPERIVAVGYCFGGSTALELLRVGGPLLGVASVHGGLDLLADDWSQATRGSSVLLCTGADDPMATREQRESLVSRLDEAEVDWELDVYSGTVHAFTNPALAESPAPHLIAYNPRSARRARSTTQRSLAELLLGLDPA